MPLLLRKALYLGVCVEKMTKSGNTVESLKVDGVKNIFIDFHAEATSEKRALMMLLQGEVSAIIGTHTHVSTDDFQISQGTAT